MSGSLFHDTRWPRAHRWLAGECEPDAAHLLSVVGAPSCLGSLTKGRCDLAPAAMRRALERFSTYNLANGVEVRSVRVRDWGDLPIARQLPGESFAPIRDAVARGIQASGTLALLGGDNSITRPGVHGLGVPLKDCGLLTLDAHFDLRDLENGLTNGNPVRALLADGLPGENIVQIGIQSFANSREYAEVARAAGIFVITAEEAHHRGLPHSVTQGLDELTGKVKAIYVDVDLDVLDRAFSPATPGSRPGGFAAWELREAARIVGACPQVKAMDLVEMDPERDMADTTALAAATCLLEFASGMVTRQ